MRQVPKFETHYSLIGSGRVSKHFQYYFSSLNIPFNIWNRKIDTPLKEIIKKSTHILLLISDDAIENFINEHPELKSKKLIHFSGATTIPGVFAAHPLMTFGPELYELGTYKTIPFICDNFFNFKEMFPCLPNPHYKIDNKQQSMYHSFIVMAGNFPQILWSYLEDQLSTKLDLPREVLSTYLKQTVENQISLSRNALTGPLVRNDQKTIESHLKNLEGTPLGNLYKSFLTFYQETSL